MTLKELLNIPFRVKMLVTRRFTWVDDKTGEERVVKEGWKAAWAMMGVHSWKWWWVKRYGTLECGCTRNPITRTMKLYAWRCPIHMAFLKRLEDEEES